jgi:lipoprotein-anchoring transpeptidase ErfK/SrfK
MKAVFAAVAVFSAMTGLSTLASAQEWDPWGGPRRAPPAQASPPDDGQDGDDTRDYYDDRGARVDNRYDGRDSDPRRYDPRYNGDRDYGARDDRYQRDDRANDERGYFEDRRYGDRDDYGAWDAAPPPGEEENLNKTPGIEAGNRPYIAPVAPPVVAFTGTYAPGSIVIDTGARKLYYVINTTSAYAYPIGVGRQGFGWTGKEKVSRIQDWPDWYPPADMRKRKPNLPERMLGGIRNPLGVKAIYLGNTLYRIHGTNDPKSIGKAESSGCFRMMNGNVLHLASLVHVGTEVTIVRSLGGRIASAAKTPKTTPRATPATPRQPERGYDPYPYRPWDGDPRDRGDDQR